MEIKINDCPKCGSYGEAQDSDFGDDSGSRTYNCLECNAQWEVLFILKATQKFLIN